MTDWELRTLRDAGVQVIDCEHRTPAAAEDGYPYITIPNMRGGRIDPSGARRMTYEDLISWNRKADPRDHDVVLSRRTNPGETAVAPLGLRYALGQNLVLLRADGSRTYPPFLRWLVRSPAWWVQIGRYLNVGAVFDSLKVADIPNFVLPIPPFEQQRRIADVLGTLDDKIALNARTASNLDAVARAIFRIRFAQAGALPPDWRLTRLGDIAPTLLGGTPSRAEPRFWGGKIPWLNSGKANEFRVLEASDYITEAGLAESATKLVPPRTTLVAITGATLGQITVTEIGACINQSLVAILGSDDLPTEYLYFWLQERIGDLLASQTGAAQQHVNKNDVNALWIMVPPRPEIRDYMGIVRPMFDRIASAMAESLTLAAMRDALLPRLLSGRLAA